MHADYINRPKERPFPSMRRSKTFEARWNWSHCRSNTRGRPTCFSIPAPCVPLSPCSIRVRGRGRRIRTRRTMSGIPKAFSLVNRPAVWPLGPIYRRLSANPPSAVSKRRPVAGSGIGASVASKFAKNSLSLVPTISVMTTSSNTIKPGISA